MAVSAIHVTDLRAALQQAYTNAGRPTPAFTDPPLIPGTTIIREVHIRELRAAVLVLEGI